MTNFSGSEKQIKWAEDIIKTFSEAPSVERLDSFREIIISVLNSVETVDASWVIHYRDSMFSFDLASEFGSLARRYSRRGKDDKVIIRKLETFRASVAGEL